MSGIRLESVTKVYPNGVRAVDDVSLDIADGEFMVLVGPSGCGKSTLLRMLAGLEDVTAGDIFIGDADVTDVPPQRRDIAMVFQNYALYPHMTVKENLEYGLKLKKMPKREREERVRTYAQKLGLDELLKRKPAALSGGQRQRVAMGRAIVIVLRGDGQQLRACRTDLAACMTKDRPQGTLRDALKGADVFIGLSVGNIVTAEDLDLMAADRIVFAMANPDPEAPPELAASHCRIFATGRSDYPNQINNALAFPGIFRGALDVQARNINEAMKLAAAKALAETIPPAALSDDYIIPSVFDKGVVPRVAKAVAAAARETGMARRRTKLSDGFTSR